MWTLSYLCRWIVALAALSPSAVPAQPPEPARPPLSAQPAEVDIFHWWVSKGERASIDVLKRYIEQQGIIWHEASASGSGTARYTDVLRQRVDAGKLPTAAQMIGFAIHEWAQTGLLENLNEVARREEWDEVVPLGIQALSKYQGNWMAAPINAHSTNWLWVNKAALDRIGGQAPDTWPDLITLLDKAKAAGILPLAIGGDAWEQTLLFESVAVSTAGAEFYRKAFIELDAKTLEAPVTATIFRRMRILKTYVDPGFDTRRWDQATDLVRKGKALLQVQGSWVDGEFVHDHLKADRDFYCFRFPDTQGVYLFNSDQYVVFKQGPGSKLTKQRLESTLMNPDFQSALNLMTGAAPARVDVSKAPFDACGQQAINDMRSANMRRTLMGSVAMGNANPPLVKEGIYDVVHRHFLGQITDEQAAQQLHDVIARYRNKASQRLRSNVSQVGKTP
ncbi:ABC transporter substrate-binding protein [Paralcaligenes sp. KSB-10]|uniref:ABC transporter substrate-binding protein n=1 Tax=Paralcaligenes sp. KSB-10 TaxID=2901142 RepID=UPI001E2F9E40|nr:ABC transporter substrate-binding protein [Paralcaligenes sp. KSB-10]UHL65447.1 ABC transporter substrate-binding protein [Paralcaligenes sp. KSB-10]